MSYTSDYFSYKDSIEITKHGYGFYAHLMAAMRKADWANGAQLRACFPGVWEDLQARYNAPGGVLDTDPDSIKEKVLGAPILEAVAP